MVTMSPSKKRPAAMTPKAFKKILADAGLNQSEAARILGVNFGTVSRWLSGYTPISAANALLIRHLIK